SSTTVILGKRKERTTSNYVLRLESPSYDESTASEFEEGSSTRNPVPICSRKRLVAKRYPCTYEGCEKAYSKPSRLAEHVRTHTGDRPFVCTTCSKTYLRESHLQAHSRSHLDQSSRPFACNEPHCDKRFWTAQHLRTHTELHQGEKPFKCTEPSCTAAFLKHTQLRQHICSIHFPPGTKPYRCTHTGCDKSFSTNQHLRTHSRTHDEKRYTCVHTTCLALQAPNTTFYPTWTALQHHIRTAHPPTCPHPECDGKTFTAQKGLRAHLKIHEQREMEEGLNVMEFDREDDAGSDTSPSTKKRRGGEVGRDWVCGIEDCTKDFKSKKALTLHQKVNHEGRRDFVCPHETCGRAFGYKHLLQRHLAKLHALHSHSEVATSEDSEASSTDHAPYLDIDRITGKSYNVRAAQQLATSHKLRCPHPDLHELSLESFCGSSSRPCEYVFSRAYDLRRHLMSEHAIKVEKHLVGNWVQHQRA
ncbi:hypothetical protein BDY19DRAFT_872574, partial [Irpex rosettiformis]